MRAWRQFAGCLVAAFLCVSTAVAGDDVDAAVKSLSTTGVFAFGGVGIAGRTTQGETDFRSLYALPADGALVAFEKVYATGNPQARAYALVAIRELSPDRFQQLLAQAAKSSDRVWTMQGCIGSRTTFAHIARQIADGGYRDFVKRGLHSAQAAIPKDQSS